MTIGSAQYSAIDLFAGAGGLSLGAGRAGLRVVAAAEFDADALATFAGLHADDSPELLEGDINRRSFERFHGEVDVVIGGPPCQPYSHGGLRMGVTDSRDGIPAFIRAVEEIRPKAFLMENVPGLAVGSARKVLDQTVAAMRELGYVVEHRVLRAADFGVSQRRQRLFIQGVLDGLPHWPRPTHGEGTQSPWVAAASLLDPINPIGEPNLSSVTYARTPDLRPSPWDGHLFNGGGRPINPDGLAPTLLASMGGNKTPWLDAAELVPAYHAHLRSGGKPHSGPVEGARRITVQEAALLQGFPVETEWFGRRSSQYRQIGNAVPVALAAAAVQGLVTAVSVQNDSVAA
ncbi:DNA cytosine methyltransferase [Curtobacterium oceanosedimentum]|uniref:DNA cytosine methyltransferase n=1 Tax=Curtobacterium oceanosedimentum TaxID=465820 RepID=UPI00339653EA